MKKFVYSGAVIAAGLLSNQVFAQDVVTQKQRPNIYTDTVTVGAKVGYVNAENIDQGAMGIGIFSDYAVSTNFLVGGTVDYWQQSYETGRSGRRIGVQDLSAGLNSKLIFTNVTTPFRPYASAGLAAHRFTVSVSEQDQENNEVDEWEDELQDVEGELGVDLGGGALYRVQPQIDVSGEFRYRNILEDTVKYDQWQIMGGLAYLM